MAGETPSNDAREEGVVLLEEPSVINAEVVAKSEEAARAAHAWVTRLWLSAPSRGSSALRKEPVAETEAGEGEASDTDQLERAS